jgi:hypothetical protein
MAINRKDIPLASTDEPKIDPTVKRTVTVNPNGTKTYKMSWVKNETNKVPAKSSSSKTPAKGGSSLRRSTPPAETKKSTYKEIEYSTLPEVKTKGIIENKPEIRTTGDASKIAKEKRSLQEIRKAAVTKRDYSRSKQGDETVSEWKERRNEEAKEVSAKIRRKADRKDLIKRLTRFGGNNNSAGTGGSGCSSC